MWRRWVILGAADEMTYAAANVLPNTLEGKRMSEEIRRSGALCDICLREQKRVPADRMFAIKSSRYYWVCEKHYLFLAVTGGRTEEEYYKDKVEE